MLTKYILDTNVYIEAYKGYYHPDIVPVYWDILKFLGKEKTIESPKQVLHEIKSQNKPQSSKENDSVGDFLYEWSRSSDNKCFLKNDLKDIDLYFREVQAAYEIVKT